MYVISKANYWKRLNDSNPKIFSRIEYIFILNSFDFFFMGKQFKWKKI